MTNKTPIMWRRFHMPDGSYFYSKPANRFQGEFYVNDLGNPIIKKVKIPKMNKAGRVIKDKKGKPALVEKDVLCGYKKRQLTLNDCPIPKFAEGLDFDLVSEDEVPQSFGGPKENAK